ncbi:MAG TPA: alpha/beta hydrolase [Pseudolysinimonas sp.]|nr:alpha/beta hydrolase [Pseudolysinimonas sp.]
MSTVAKSTIEVLGGTVGYRRQGSGEALVVLAGAWLTNKDLELYSRLADTFEVIVPDLPGFGQTDIPEFYSSFADTVIHLDTLFDELGLTTVHLVGHGFGGWVAAEYAVSHPSRLSSLSLLAPWGLRPNEGEPLVNMFRTTPDEEFALLLGDDVQAYFSVLVPDPAELMADSFQERTAIARVAWNPRYDIKLEHYLARVTAPTLVLIPETDRVVAPSVAVRYAAALHTSPVVISSASGSGTEHLFILQQPDSVADAISTVAHSGTRA